GESPQALSSAKIPFAVTGRISKAGQIDRYKIDIAPEASLRFTVMANQIGSSIDAMLEVRNAKGDLLASNDDFGTSPDPRLDFKAPKGLDSLIIGIKDTSGRGSEGGIY